MNREEQLELALKELLGFAKRNLARAKQAYLASLGELDESEHKIAAAREHEAQRFYNVVKDRVAQALQ